MKTIFVALDADDLATVVRILRDAGHRVIGVSDAETALSVLQGLRPDLVIAEYPSLAAGGDVLLEHLCGPGKGRCRTLAFLSDFARGLAAAAIADGFDAVYARPIVATTLLPVVDQLLTRPLDAGGGGGTTFAK